MELTPDEFDTAVMEEFAEPGGENDGVEPELGEPGGENEVEPEFDDMDTHEPQNAAMLFRVTIELDLERAILAKASAEKVQRRANAALAKAQAIEVMLGTVDKSMEKAKVGKNDFNRKHALTLLAAEEQQSMLDAEDVLTDAVAQYRICNNRATDAGLLR